MPNYYVNSNAQPTGEHEVHQEGTCPYPAAAMNRVALGWHADCTGAVIAARQIYANVDGCYWCSGACHTR